MANFLTEDFLLDTETARRLYHGYAVQQPIFDYHCHLPPVEIATDYQFRNMWDIWLKGDHYKWRAMRTNGVPERLCTGDADDWQKFLAWAKTVPLTIGNPLYHWTHLELRRPFGITDCELSEKSAESVWQRCNAMLAQPDFSARGIMKRMNVRMAGTMDDPIDDLRYHKIIAEDPDFTTKVLPCWRPDKACDIHQPGFAAYLEKLEAVSDCAIDTMQALYRALVLRLDHFAAHGCRIADHALDVVTYAEADDAELTRILQDKRQGREPSPRQAAAYRTAVLLFLGREYHRRGWAQQYHIGALRSANTRMVALVGEATGFDSIDDQPLAQPLARLLDALDRTQQLPRTILYCLNPRDNEVIATMLGNFQGDEILGKIQFGSGWWFNDQKDGMIRQMTQLSNLGLLSRFIGMLTDSRSFLSYTRHEYFRRILCRMIGRWVADGEAPDDEALLGTMVERICFANARDYFGIDV